MKAGTYRKPYVSKAERINRQKTRIEAAAKSRRELQKFVEEHPEKAAEIAYGLNELRMNHPYLF